MTGGRGATVREKAPIDLGQQIGSGRGRAGDHDTIHPRERGRGRVQRTQSPVEHDLQLREILFHAVDHVVA